LRRYDEDDEYDDPWRDDEEEEDMGLDGDRLEVGPAG
jgi:hypothetical protein